MNAHREHRNVNGSVRRVEHTCMKCRQRIRPWSKRWSIGRGLFVHPGCLIRGSKNTITAREIALQALKAALGRRAAS
jgi:hypothetical protein